MTLDISAGALFATTAAATATPRRCSAEEAQAILADPPVDTQECLRLDGELQSLVDELCRQESRPVTPLLMPTRATRHGIRLESCEQLDPLRVWEGTEKMMRQLQQQQPPTATAAGGIERSFPVERLPPPQAAMPPVLPLLEQSEFLRLPLHLRNTVDLAKLNQGVEELNALLRKKYNKSSAAAAKAAREEPPELQNYYWFAEKELRNAPGLHGKQSVFKMISKGNGILAILRHLHFLHPMPDGKEKRYAVADGCFRE